MVGKEEQAADFDRALLGGALGLSRDDELEC
jgi:hypothetical protein